MILGARSRRSWFLCLMIVVAVGILSRVVRTGSVIFDKYLGDALYAAMVCVILRLFWSGRRAAVSAMVVMIVIELFQLTLIPAHMLASEHVAVRVFARLLGTEFGFLDLVAYLVGIGSAYVVDYFALFSNHGGTLSG